MEEGANSGTMEVQGATEIENLEDLKFRRHYPVESIMHNYSTFLLFQKVIKNCYQYFLQLSL